MWKTYARVAGQTSDVWTGGVRFVTDKWVDAIDYSGHVLPVIGRNVRAVATTVPGGARLLGVADSAQAAIVPPLVAAAEANYRAAERVLGAQREATIAYLTMSAPDHGAAPDSVREDAAVDG
ncbi:MAG: hypothetical protein QM662_07895 [Gordonia sp. (in: high G+C Gram-positive bacteria)]